MKDDDHSLQSFLRDQTPEKLVMIRLKITMQWYKTWFAHITFVLNQTTINILNCIILDTRSLVPKTSINLYSEEFC